MSRWPTFTRVATAATLGLASLWAGPQGGAAPPRPATCGPAWTRVAVPNSNISAPFDVRPLDSADAWAVGEHGKGLPLIDHWDGARWTTVQVPKPGDVAVLTSISASGPDDVWAVGTYVDPYKYSFAEHWDGSAWILVPTPNVPRKTMNFLYDVVAISLADAWAVGLHDPAGGSGQTPDVVHWDGTSWTRVSTPAPEGSAVLGVDALGPDDVWVLGRTSTGVSFILRWDGSTWTHMRTARQDQRRPPSLAFITVLSPTDAWLAGTHGPGIGSVAPISEHWDGTSWTRVPVPDIQGEDYVTGLAAVGTTDMWMVGYRRVGSPVHAEAWQWDGAAWRYEPPPPSSVATRLDGVGALPSGEVWAVGYTLNDKGQTDGPLAFHRCD